MCLLEDSYLMSCVFLSDCKELKRLIKNTNMHSSIFNHFLINKLSDVEKKTFLDTTHPLRGSNEEQM